MQEQQQHMEQLQSNSSCHQHHLDDFSMWLGGWGWNHRLQQGPLGMAVAGTASALLATDAHVPI